MGHANRKLPNKQFGIRRVEFCQSSPVTILAEHFFPGETKGSADVAFFIEHAVQARGNVIYSHKSRIPSVPKNNSFT